MVYYCEYCNGVNHLFSLVIGTPENLGDRGVFAASYNKNT